MKPNEDPKEGVEDSQEVIDASFELGSSSLGLGSYDEDTKQGKPHIWFAWLELGLSFYFQLKN